MKKLNRKEANLPVIFPVKILQFGGGNFLRAFVDRMVDVLNDASKFGGSVAVVKPTPGGDYHEIKEQDGLFHFLQEGIEDGKPVSKTILVKSIFQIINPYSEFEKYLETAKNSTIRFVVSNTTEAGIAFNEKDQRSDRPAGEFPAKLTQWLYARYEYFRGSQDKGCIFLPCELIEGNGKALKEAILNYVDLWELKPGFRSWILEHNYFCNTLVDRIVSGFPLEKAEEIQNELGYQDDLLVVGEVYHSWLIEAPAFVQNELPFSETDLNVKWVNDLALYRKLKVRMLNGAHTAMVPVGYLAGEKTVGAVMQSPVLTNFLEELLQAEVTVTMADDFAEEELSNYKDDVLNRFKNPYIQHQLMSISLNSISKFNTRLLPTLLDYVRIKQALPNHICFALASLLVFYKGEFNGEEIDLKDDKKSLEFFRKIWRNYDKKNLNIKQVVEQLLGSNSPFGKELAEIPELKPKVSHFVEQIMDQGILKALALNRI